MADLYFGKYSGIVRDNRDADELGILLVSVPTIFPEDEQVPARAALPYGMFFVPENETHVWVEFEGGDTASPLWTGVQHVAGTWAPEARKNPPTVRAFKTAAGHLLLFDDTEGSESVLLVDGKNAHELTFTADNQGGEDHEMVVVRADDPADLPTDADGAVDEEQIAEDDFIGEIEEFPSSEQETATFEMDAGTYVLFCNITETEDDGEVESHFAEGMVTTFTAE